MAEEEEAPEEEPKEEAPKEEPSSKYEEEKEKKPENTLVMQALEAADSLKKQNKIMSENLKKLEELQAINIVSGKSEAGEEVKEKTQEEKDQEEADKVLNMFKE